MRAAPLVPSFVLLGFVALSSGPSTQTTGSESDAAVRIGVYDNRAIAIAFAQSRFNSIGDLVEARAKAAEAGDDARLAELEAKGASLQRRLHFQGFGRYPVDDLLAHVEDELPAVAERLDLDAIVWLSDYHGEHVEIVDVTDELAALFKPEERALKWIEQIGDAEFVDLDTLVEMRPNE